MSGSLFFKDTKAEITLIPGFERLGSVTVAADGTFSTEVKIPDLAEGYDPHAIIVTGQGTDGLFAFLIEGITLGDPPTSSTARGNRGSTTSIDELRSSYPGTTGARRRPSTVRGRRLLRRRLAPPAAAARPAHAPGTGPARAELPPRPPGAPAGALAGPRPTGACASRPGFGLTRQRIASTTIWSGPSADRSSRPRSMGSSLSWSGRRTAGEKPARCSSASRVSKS